ncbi:unnamed protein product [Lupinus luteus]|uniref:DIRP domain-containing protein n=1 Tax=Lupinus luteus TaxID=3873 RepID=A0AAV1XXN2_LUPLU
MAPSRKSRSVNKRFSNIHEAASSKDKSEETASKNKQKASLGTQKKRKLADMLGPQWNKGELGRFYESYRKYGKDWKKVALAVRNRSMEMVEALYTMNRAYLSLPEGTASAVGLTAMMTDHYSVLGGSYSGKESNEDAEISKKPKKRLRGKHLNDSKALDELDEHFSDHSQSHSIASGDGCLSLLKKRQPGIKPHAVRKRTPRVPISHSIGKDNGEKIFSSARQRNKQMVDSNDVAHKIALALTEASQRGVSSTISGSPNKKTVASPGQKSGNKANKLLPNNFSCLFSVISLSGKLIVGTSCFQRARSEIAVSKFCSSDLDKGSSELSLGSTEGDNGYYSRETTHWSSIDNTGRGRNHKKRLKHYNKNLEPEEKLNKDLDDIKEASSGTDDGKNLSFFKSHFDTDFTDAKKARSSYKGSMKRSKNLLIEKDEGSAFDALKTLADLSSMMPETNPNIEPSAQFKEGNHDIDESKMKTHNVRKIENTASSKHGKAFSDSIAAGHNSEGAYQLNAGGGKRKQNSFTLKATDEMKKSMVKGKRSRQLKMVKFPGKLSSSMNDKGKGDDSILPPIKVSSTNQVSLVNKGKSRRKIEKPIPMVQRDQEVSGNIFSCQHNNSAESLQSRSSSEKEKLSNCLSSQRTRRWCTFEWFYSAIDYPWFSKREFMEYLDHVGLGHVPRLTRIEWGVIRSSLGRPRRFSKQFLIEEKDKLNQYRESVRSRYAEVLSGTNDGLPTDLARPLIVGQRVIAIHPKTREINDGSILTVDHCRYRVQFDQPELGVEFVMDIDCMPLYPFENVPTSLIQHNVASARIDENLGKLKQGMIVEHTILSPSENSDTVKGLHVSPTMHGSSPFSKQGNSSGSKSQAKVETANTQLALSSQPFILEHVHPKEADILAISELARALDKKEHVLSELKHMNDGVSESLKFGGNPAKDTEPFKRNYAPVLKQLTEANEQVSSALFFLRQRNTYQGSSSLLSLKPVTNSDDPGGQASSINCSACINQESISHEHLSEIVESSRRKAQMLVVQATKLSVDDPTASAANSLPVNSIHVTQASQDQLIASTLNPLASCHLQEAELNRSSDQNELNIPSELISHCLATLVMIQKCTERQFPPADVAQVLDSAVTSLQPFCSKNLPIYSEIQKCMGIIRNQILALVPT